MKSSTDTLLEVVSRKLDVKEDQHDIFAKNVAEKLRHLDPTMRIISEKLINEVLFEAQMGSLNRRAYIYIPPFEKNNHLTSSWCKSARTLQFPMNPVIHLCNLQIQMILLLNIFHLIRQTEICKV